MAHINLLPWREAARKEKQKQYLSILSVIAGTVFVIIFFISLYYGALLSGQEKRNAFINKEIAVLDQKIVEIRKLNDRKRDLQQRMTLIEQLQGSRNLGTQVLDEVASVVPAGIYLTKLEKKGQHLLIVGKSESNNRLANMMRKIEESSLLAEPVLRSIVAGQAQPALLSDFEMQLKVTGYEQIQGDADES
ncbi:PilN domain-containing protein [Flocculibacter collagenilyticus]|uniref:PilN domain-containing protein n=1 Tax=Flocculibacter collagenilyticus TaxID=2744479 RepID=UPI0018F3E41A|nr:PilN domain-containing protein [Flocculibacter collagenilyticus]